MLAGVEVVREVSNARWRWTEMLVIVCGVEVDREVSNTGRGGGRQRG